MSEHQQATNITPDSRKDYRTLKLVKHGHFLDVVQDAIPTDGSQLEKQPTATG